MRFSTFQNDSGAWTVQDADWAPPRVPFDDSPRVVAICKERQDAETIARFMGGNLVGAPWYGGHVVTITRETEGWALRVSDPATNESKIVAIFKEEPEARATAAFQSAHDSDKKYRAWEMHQSFLSYLRSVSKS